MKYIYKLFIAVLLTASCSGWLDKFPETERTDAAAFDRPEDFIAAVNLCYTWTPKLFSSHIGVVARDYDADIACEASSTISPVSESSYGTSETDSRYKTYFARIRDINHIFANQDKIEDKSGIARYLAEAHFFRAYISWLMFADYGPLTIVKSVLDTDSEELYEARATRDDFADFIISDLEAAISSQSLPAESSLRGGREEGRITSGAANALLARVCLFEGTWQKYHYGNTARSSELFSKAIAAAGSVMSDTSYKLFRDDNLGDESYRYMFTLESTARTNPAGITKSANHEYIFRVRHNEDRSGNWLYTSGADRVYKTVASRKMIEMHLGADGQPADYDYTSSYTSFLEGKDPRLKMNFCAPNEYGWCYSSGRVDWTSEEADKERLHLRPASDLGYPSRKWVTERTVAADEWGIDIPLIRLAEIYLIYAEAKYELDGQISDDDLDISVNLIRDRVGMAHLSNSNIPAGSTMLDEIRRERAVELYLEGHRYDDLRRWAIAEQEMSGNFEYIYMGQDSAFLEARTDNGSNAVMPDPESISADGYAIKQQSSKRRFLKKHYLKPLPRAQLKLNGKLEQNPDWK